MSIDASPIDVPRHLSATTANTDGVASQILGKVRAHVRAVLEIMQEDDDTEPAYPKLDIPTDRTSLGQLASVLRLSRTEHAMLWLLVAHELCPRTRLMIRQQNTEQLADPTIDAVRRLVGGMTPSLRIWGELGEDAPLRRHVLIERTDGDTDTPEHRQTLKASRRAISLALGATGIDPEIATHARIDEPRPLEELVYDGVPVRDLEQAIRNGSGIVVACGRDGIGKRSMLAAIAGKLGHRVLAFDARQLPRQELAARRQLRVLQREAALSGGRTVDLQTLPVRRIVEWMPYLDADAKKAKLEQKVFNFQGILDETGAHVKTRYSPMAQAHKPAFEAKMASLRLPVVSEMRGSESK